MSDKLSAYDERTLVVQVREGKLYPLTDPDEIEISQQLLDDANPQFILVSDDGIVTVFFEEGIRRYRLGPDVFGVRVGKKIQDG